MSELVTKDAISRREFVGGAAAAGVAAYSFVPGALGEGTEVRQVRRPASTINGVKLGIIVGPYVFSGEAASIDTILDTMVRLGLGWGEVQIAPIETSLGAPLPQARNRTQQPLTTQQQAEARKRAESALREWRLSQSMNGFRALRKRFEDAGVVIDILRFPMGPSTSDDEVEYAFDVARAVGASGISCEPPVSETKRLGKFAAKHKFMLGYHNHTNVTSVEAFGRPGSWEQAFFYSPFNGANFDIGHFTAANSAPALTIDFIREYHHRITNLHIKDRPVNQGPNVPWGQGDTPIREILRMMRDERYPFQATIELEYPIPPGSTVLAEMAKCVEYARAALAA